MKKKVLGEYQCALLVRVNCDAVGCLCRAPNMFVRVSNGSVWRTSVETIWRPFLEITSHNIHHALVAVVYCCNKLGATPRRRNTRPANGSKRRFIESPLDEVT